MTTAHAKKRGGGSPHSAARLEPAVLDIAGVVAYVQPMTRSRVYEEIRAGRLHAFHIGRRLAFHRADVDAWVDGLEDR
jgi:excisionase family DNA binding protein